MLASSFSHCLSREAASSRWSSDHCLLWLDWDNWLLPSIIYNRWKGTQRRAIRHEGLHWSGWTRKLRRWLSHFLGQSGRSRGTKKQAERWIGQWTFGNDGHHRNVFSRWTHRICLGRLVALHCFPAASWSWSRWSSESSRATSTTSLWSTSWNRSSASFGLLCLKLSLLSLSTYGMLSGMLLVVKPCFTFSPWLQGSRWLLQGWWWGQHILRFVPTTLMCVVLFWGRLQKP